MSAVEVVDDFLTPRWTTLIPHGEQERLVNSPARFKVAAAGRGSGKTELAMRELQIACWSPPKNVELPTFVACGPTRNQMKRVWWEHLKALTPPSLRRSISETELMITFWTGARLMLLGLDQPTSAEGLAIDGLVVDEIQEVKPDAWKSTLQPTLSRRGRRGWAWFIGRPRGRGYFYQLWSEARTKQDWDAFKWKSEEIIDPESIAEAKRTLDPVTYAQEYDAEWVTFEGRAYYAYDSIKNVRSLSYAPARPLILTFDFNVSPGSACVLQEQLVDGDRQLATCAIGEVHVPRGSNTPIVCERLATDWAHHKGPVEVYGDATGGGHTTAATGGCGR